MRCNDSSRRGFSLIEVMIVVVIIGLLAGVVTYATTSYMDKAKRQKARSDIGRIDAAGGAIEEPHPEALLQRLDRLA